MILEELFQKLSYGELSNLSLAVDATGTIKPNQHHRLIHFVNEGLVKLYSKFVLSEKSEIITLIADQVDYPLNATDSIKILAVYNAYGQSYELNSSHNPSGIYTPTADLIKIPNVSTDSLFTPGLELDVFFQAKHPALVTTIQDPGGANEILVLNQVITLPDYLYPGLTAYIASQVYKGINTPEAQIAAATHYSFYQLTCDEVERFALVNTGTVTPNGKFGDRGWV